MNPFARAMTEQKPSDTGLARNLKRAATFAILLALGVGLFVFNGWKGRRDAERHSLASDPTLPYVTFEWVDEKRLEVQDILGTVGSRPKLLRETSEAYFVFKPRQTPDEPINPAVKVPKELVRNLRKDSP